MLEQINEPIEVEAYFGPQGGARPLKFIRHGREYVIEKVNLMYSKWSGRTKLHYFAVSDGANYYKLCLDSENLKWTLVEIYAE